MIYCSEEFFQYTKKQQQTNLMQPFPTWPDNTDTELLFSFFSQPSSRYFKNIVWTQFYRCFWIYNIVDHQNFQEYLDLNMPVIIIIHGQIKVIYGAKKYKNLSDGHNLKIVIIVLFILDNKTVIRHLHVLLSQHTKLLDCLVSTPWEFQGNVHSSFPIPNSAVGLQGDARTSSL